MVMMMLMKLNERHDDDDDDDYANIRYINKEKLIFYFKNLKIEFLSSTTPQLTQGINKHI